MLHVVVMCRGLQGVGSAGKDSIDLFDLMVKCAADDQYDMPPFVFAYSVVRKAMTIVIMESFRRYQWEVMAIAVSDCNLNTSDKDIRLCRLF